MKKIALKTREIKATKQDVKKLEESLKNELQTIDAGAVTGKIFGLEKDIICFSTDILKILKVPETLILRYRKRQYESLASRYAARCSQIFDEEYSKKEYFPDKYAALYTIKRGIMAGQYFGFAKSAAAVSESITGELKTRNR